MRDEDKPNDQLIRELEELRTRVAQLQTNPPESITEELDRLREQQNVLLRLALSPELLAADLKPALEEITEAAGSCLGVARTSVWLYDEDRSLIRCLDLFERDARQHSEGLEILAENCPAYFEALARERAIAAHDAISDARTSEFAESYLGPLGISSMLDAPIRVGGHMLGVICHEHVGPPRTWTQDEQAFAGSIGDLASLAIASNQRRRDEAARRKLERKVQHAQKLESLGVLAGGIAHDFNNLLVGILGNAGLALEDLAHSSISRECVGDIETAAKRAADLCHQLLAYSGKGKFVITPLNLNDIVMEMGQLLEVSVSKKALLKYRLSGALPAVDADATQIGQIIMNLITNASEALEDKPGVVTITTGVTTCDRHYLERTHLGEHLPEGNYVFVEVSDDGCGLDQEAMQRIFDPFYTSKFTGRGLGLAAVQGIVRGHHGAISIYTEPGKGTAFKVLFPSSQRQAARPAGESDEIKNWRGEGVVLLVDDDETVRAVGKRMMERAGFEVRCAVDGSDAIEMLERHSHEITCVVLDLTMPRMGGEEAFVELKRIRDDLPIVLSSGYNEQEAIAGFVGKGLAGFVKKPYVASELIGKLREALTSPSRSRGGG